MHIILDFRLSLGIMLDSDHEYADKASITNLDIEALISESQDGFLRRVLIVGDNVRFEKKCVKIYVDVHSVWDLYNIKSSVEYGVFLRRYCSWVTDKGLQYARNEEVEVTLSVNDVDLFVHLQHTPTAKRRKGIYVLVSLDQKVVSYYRVEYAKL